MNRVWRRNGATRATGQRGTVMILVALSLTVLVGTLALAIDSGKSYINKTELQSAADSCALAAVKELSCSSANASCLNAARAAGQMVSALNRSDLQNTSVSIANADITFSSSLNGSYATSSPNNARFVRCTASAAVAPWLMSALGFGANTVGASAVATLAPSKSFCLNTPMALCSTSTAAPDYGYSTSTWIRGDSSHSNAGGGNPENDSLTNGLRWANLTGNTGTTQIRDQLINTSPVCGFGSGSAINVSGGVQQGIKNAYNSRFGLYQNGAGGYSTTTAPPDHSGYAYPTATITDTTNPTGAYADYMSRATGYTVFNAAAYTGGNAAYQNSPNNATSALLQTNGKSGRRVIAVPIVDCTAATPTVKATACLLMLNPMSNGNTSTLWFQYLGNAASGTTPCPSSGSVGGGTSTGPLVPALAQ